MLKGFSEINKKMLCLSRESVERVSVGTGSGELQRPIYLQPLGGQIGGWDWGEASKVLGAQNFRRFQLQRCKFRVITQQ